MRAHAVPPAEPTDSTIIHFKATKRARLVPAEFTGSYTVPVPKSSAATSASVQLVSRRARGTGRVLHLFSGPSGRSDGLSAFLRELGWECDEFDSKCNNDEAQNLADDTVWSALMQKIKSGYYDYIISGTPCETFSRARFVRPGPIPLRSVEHPYGLPGLSYEHKEQVRLGNLFAARTRDACIAVVQVGGGYIMENPEPWEGYPSIWDLQEIKELQEKTGGSIMDIHQCPYGAETQKPTRLLYKKVKCEVLTARCKHPVRRWVDDKGKEYWAPHPRSVQRKREDGSYATKALGAWPRGLNKAFAILVNHAGPRIPYSGVQ